MTEDSKELLEDNNFNKEEEETIGYIVSGLVNISDQYDVISSEKSQNLNYSIWLFSLASICFAVDIIIISFYCK